MKSSSRFVALWCAAVMIASAFRAEGGLSFVQITDPHFFDADTKNDRALSDCVEEINRRGEGGSKFTFVVVTGDLGVEQLVSQKVGDESQLLSQEEIEKKQGPQKFADAIAPCVVKKWLFLPGNNDLINEDPGELPHYTQFISSLREQLKGRGFQIIDLTDANSNVDQEGDYTFIGFNNASFKSNDKADNVRDWEKSDKDAIAKVTAALKTAKKNAYIFYHIPEVDDPYYVLNPNSKPEEWFAKRGVTKSPYKYSSWAVTDGVRKEWDMVVAEDQVKGLFAGHFHDNHRDTYRNLRWLVTPGYTSATLVKLRICPPLAEKRQPNKNEQARGFQVVTLDDDGKPNVEIVWYNDALFATDETRRGSGPLLTKNILLSVDPATNTAGTVIQLFNAGRQPMKVGLSATDFVSTTTRKSIGASVTFAAGGQTTAAQEFYETTIPVGATIAVRVDAAKIWEAGESVAQILNYGSPIGTMRALKSRVPFAVRLVGESPEIDFVKGERQRIALHNDDSMTYRATAQVAFGNRLSDPVPIDLPRNGDSFFAINLPSEWFPCSSWIKRQIIDGEVVLALDPPSGTSAPDLPRRRIPFKGSLNRVGPGWQGAWGFLFAIGFLAAGGAASLTMGNYFPNQLRESALAEQLEALRLDIAALPTSVDSEFRSKLRAETHRLRTELKRARMISAETSAMLDAAEGQTNLLRKKTELVEALYRLKEKLVPFTPSKTDEQIKPSFTTADETFEILRARNATEVDLGIFAEKVRKAIYDLFQKVPPDPGSSSTPDLEKIRKDFAERTPVVVVNPARPEPYEVVTLAVEFLDGEKPPSEVACHWNCGDGFTESGWKIFHYYSNPKGQDTVTAKFLLHGEPITTANGQSEIEKTIETHTVRGYWIGRRNLAAIGRLSLALGVALIGLLAIAQGQLAKSDLFVAATGIFILGFTANAVKDLLVPKTAKT